MKILQVCPYDYSRPGGVKTHIENLSETLRKRDHEVDIIAPNINVDKITEKNIYFFGSNKSYIFWGGTKIDLNIVLKKERKILKNFLRNNNYDIVHYHTIWNPMMPWQVRYYSKSKNVATFHDTPADTFLAQKIIGKVVMPTVSSLISIFLDGIISVSKFQAQYINKFSSRKPVIIPNGINPKKVSKGKPIKKYKNGMFNLLFLGRFEERKGLIYALKAFKILKTKYENLRLLVAGDGESRLEAEEYIKVNNLKDIEFFGFLDENTKLNLFQTADIYLAPAIYGESFGIVLLEAMACGLSMAGFGNEGYKNVINNEWLDFFPKPKDTDTFARQIEILINDADKREAMKAWGLNEVQKYSWDSITEQILDVYNVALKR